MRFIAYLEYESDALYGIGLDESTGRVRLYHEENGLGDWEPLINFPRTSTVKDADEEAEDALIEQAKELVVEHGYESDGTFRSKTLK